MNNSQWPSDSLIAWGAFSIFALTLVALIVFVAWGAGDVDLMTLLGTVSCLFSFY